MEEKKRNIKEIDILGIIKIIANKKLFLAKVIGLFALIGICVSLVNPKEYTSEVILAPEMNTGGIGLSESLSSMVSTFGIDLVVNLLWMLYILRFIPQFFYLMTLSYHL